MLGLCQHHPAVVDCILQKSLLNCLLTMAQYFEERCSQNSLRSGASRGDFSLPTYPQIME